MVALALAAAVLQGAPMWKSVYFEDVRLHKGAPVVTVQLAWKEEDKVSTDYALPGIVSVFSGPRGHRTALTSTSIGTLSSYGRTNELIIERASGEAFLNLAMQEGGKWTGALFIFDGYRPRRLFTGDYFLKGGQVREFSRATKAGYHPPADHYPDPWLERTLRFNPKTRTFTPGRWRETTINPPAVRTITGRVSGHSFKVRLAKRNFRLGNRRVAFKNGVLYVDGLHTYGQDTEVDKLKSLAYRKQLFHTELTSFRIWIDGKELRVPGKLWKACYSPNLGSLTATVSKDGKTLTLTMSGSDGAGGYTATWKLRTSGHHSRKVESDC